MQKIWSRREISIADELMELAPKLTQEFLEYHKDFDTTFSGGISYAASNPEAILDEHEKVVWKVEGLRYALPDKNIEHNFFLQPRVRMIFSNGCITNTKIYCLCGL